MAVLLKDIGKEAVGLQAMEDDAQLIREQVVAGVVHSNALALAECKIERYKSWLLSS